MHALALGTISRPMINEFGLGAVEEAIGPFIVKEGLFGVHVELRNGTRKMLFPIYSGMAYVSAYYTQLTPVITSTRAILAIERIQNGPLGVGRCGVAAAVLLGMAYTSSSIGTYIYLVSI